VGRKLKNAQKHWLPFKARVFLGVSLMFVGSIALTLILSLTQDRLSATNNICANTKSCLESFKYKVENGVQGYFAGKLFDAPEILQMPVTGLTSAVLGESDNLEEKRIYIDLATQTLTAYDGENLFMKTLVSTGKWFPTPTGEFRIWVKLKSTRMSGGEGEDYYDLPNVPFTMYFEGDTLSRNRGFAIHGAYWHNNFGHPMSHGCVNMRHTDVEKLYNWANPPTVGNTTHSSIDNLGTRVTIFGEAPL